MKFKTILSLSASLCMLLPHDATHHTFTPEKTETHTTPPQLLPIPDLTFRTDTIVYDGDTTKSHAAGLFVPTTNEIIIYHFLPQDGTASQKRWCESQLRGRRFVIRHEAEHARKAHITRTQFHLPPYQRAQIAIMDEMMASGGEIIEAITYRLETNKRPPVNRNFLYKTDSMLQSKSGFCSVMGVYSQDIADIILKSAADKFVGVYDLMSYRKRVHQELQAARHPKYIPHNHCDGTLFARFDPQNNEWGALWTYKITPFIPNGNIIGNKCGISSNVDIWNTASEDARQYVLQKVDSCIRLEMEPGQMLHKSFFAKTR